MEYKAWHYRSDGTISGTVCGLELETVKKAKEAVARQHGLDKENVEVKEAGTEDWR